jgi:hypothetical protein
MLVIPGNTGRQPTEFVVTPVSGGVQLTDWATGGVVYG